MWQFNLDILTSRKPFKNLAATKKLVKLMQVLRWELTSRTDPAKLEFVEDGLNKVWDARFILYATDGELDYWGGTLGKPRNEGESDDNYRQRLLNALRQSVNVLTIKALKDAIAGTTGIPGGGAQQNPQGPLGGLSIQELYIQTWNWPFDWQDGEIWQDYVRLLDMLAPVSPIIVLDEQFTAIHDTWVDLARTDIVDDSEVITSLDGQITYTKGVDYEMDYPGGRIMALSTGTMQDGFNYLADYNYRISDAELSQIATDIESVKNAPAEVFLVEDSGQGYYIRKRSVL